MTPINHIRSLGELSAERQVLADPNIWRAKIKTLHWQLGNSPFFPRVSVQGNMNIIIHKERGENNWVLTSEELNDIGNSQRFCCCGQIAWVGFKLTYWRRKASTRQHYTCKMQMYKVNKIIIKVGLPNVNVILVSLHFFLPVWIAGISLTHRLMKCSESAIVQINGDCA